MATLQSQCLEFCQPGWDGRADRARSLLPFRKERRGEEGKGWKGAEERNTLVGGSLELEQPLCLEVDRR